MVGIFFICTAWGRKNGGINSINYGLTKSVAQIIKNENRNWKVFCIITEAEVDSDEEDRAKEEGIILKYYKRPLQTLKTGIGKIIQEEKFEQLFFVGHDVFTGGFSNKLAQQFNNSLSVVLHHMSYESYYYIRERDPNKIKEKEKEQETILAHANIVLAIGPLLFDTARDIINNNESKSVIRIEEIIPGLEDIKPNENNHINKTIIVFGRLEDKNNMLKQTGLAFDAIGSYVRNRPEKQGKIRLKAYGYAEDLELNQTELMNRIAKSAKRNVNTKAYKYIENAEELFKEIKNSDLCIMPSLEEGFGLVAYEAIAAGVPVIISKSSGLYMFLSSKEGGALDGYVGVIDVQGNSQDQEHPYTKEDLKNLEQKIADIFDNYSKSKKNALELRKLLLEQHYTWEYCARNVIDILKAQYQESVSDEIRFPKAKNERLLSEYLKATIIPNFCSILGTAEGVICKIIKYSNNRNRRFTVFSSNSMEQSKMRVRPIDEGTIGVMNELIRTGKLCPIVITDFTNGICYYMTNHEFEIIENAAYGVPDHHVLCIISVPILHNNEIEGAITFDIYDNTEINEILNKKDKKILENIYSCLRTFSEILTNYFFYFIKDDIKFNEGRKMIKERVLVSFGGLCPMGCKHCFAHDVQTENFNDIEEIVRSIDGKDFDVIYVSHNYENFFDAKQGISLCEELYSTYKKDICVTTRCVLSGADLQRIKKLNEVMSANNNSLTFCISIPALDSYKIMENVEYVLTPQARIDFAKLLKKIGIRSLITIRPLFPNHIVPSDEIKKIVDLAGNDVDGFLTGGLVVTDNIIQRLGIDKEFLSFISDEKTEYLNGIDGDFLHVDVNKEIDELQQYCIYKKVPFFRHSMEALNYFESI